MMQNFSNKLEDALKRRSERLSAVQAKSHRVDRRLILAPLIGLLTIISNLVITYQDLNFFDLEKVKNWLGLFSLSPSAVTAFLQSINLSSMLVYFTGLGWVILSVLCGVGLLRLSERLRAIFVKLCLINSLAIMRFLFPILKLWVIRKQLPPALFHRLLPLVIMLIYIIYFTRSNVKKQFM